MVAATAAAAAAAPASGSVNVVSSCDPSMPLLSNTDSAPGDVDLSLGCVVVVSARCTEDASEHGSRTRDVEPHTSTGTLLGTASGLPWGSWHTFFAAPFSSAPKTCSGLFRPEGLVGDAPRSCGVGLAPSLVVGDIAFALRGARARLFAGDVGSIVLCRWRVG